MSTGRRYSLTEKREILRYRANHTYEETSQKFGVSQMTLARWSKRIMLNSSNTGKLDLSHTSDAATPESERLKFIGSLLDVLKFNEGVKYVALISDSGEFIASTGAKEVPDEMVLANTAALLALGDRASRAFMQGDLDMVLTKASSGATLILGAGPKACLVMFLDDTMNLLQFFPVIDKVRTAIKNFY